MSDKKYHEERGEVPPPPVGCPVNHEWSPISDDYLADPYGIAAELAADRFVYAESLGYLVLNRMEDIEAVFVDHETFSSGNVQDPVFPLGEEAQKILAAPDFDPVAVMSNRAEPDHGRIRIYTKNGFSKRRLKTLEPYIRRRAHELIDEMVAAGSPAEFINAFAFPLPGETVFRFIGFPEGDDEMLKVYCGDRKAFSWGRPTGEEQARIAQQMLDYWRYCRDFTAYKRDHRGDDFASELLDAYDTDDASDPSTGSGITYREVESVIYGLSFAGHEAVTALFCNTLLCLLNHREQWDAVVADPSLIPNAIEEVLRYESSQISWRRVATRDTTIGDLDVPAGTEIFMNFAAANNEPGRFDTPRQFDITRTNARNHISFGKGVHFCLGSKMARFETQIVTEILAERLPTLRLVEDQDLEYFPNITFRGPGALRVAWD